MQGRAGLSLCHTENSLIPPQPLCSSALRNENLFQTPQDDAMILSMWQEVIIGVARFFDACSERVYTSAGPPMGDQASYQPSAIACMHAFDDRALCSSMFHQVHVIVLIAPSHCDPNDRGCVTGHAAARFFLWAAQRSACPFCMASHCFCAAV